MENQNLAGKRESLKQKSWDTRKIWWFPVLCKGKLHVDCFGIDFPGETAAGARILVDKVRSAVNVRFPNVVAKPDTIFTDRGRGFYEPASGRITAAYKAGLRANQFKAMMGDNAAEQPGSLQYVLLHETAVSLMRHRLSISTPTNCWQETREENGRRLKRCCDEVNRECDVEGLCRGFTKRLKQLQQRQGGRLKK